MVVTGSTSSHWHTQTRKSLQKRWYACMLVFQGLGNLNVFLCVHAQTLLQQNQQNGKRGPSTSQHVTTRCTESASGCLQLLISDDISVILHPHPRKWPCSQRIGWKFGWKLGWVVRMNSEQLWFLNWFQWTTSILLWFHPILPWFFLIGN